MELDFLKKSTYFKNVHDSEKGVRWIFNYKEGNQGFLIAVPKTYTSSERTPVKQNSDYGTNIFDKPSWFKEMYAKAGHTYLEHYKIKYELMGSYDRKEYFYPQLFMSIAIETDNTRSWYEDFLYYLYFDHHSTKNLESVKKKLLEFDLELEDNGHMIRIVEK